MSLSLRLCLSPSQSKQILLAYGPKLRVQIDCSQGGRTKQSFREECDINNIMARFKKTGVLDFAAKNEPRYADCTGANFTQAMNIIAAANSMFEELPSHLRARFENDPVQFLDFVQDDKNRDEAQELGLLKPEEVDNDQAGGDSLRRTQEPVQGAGGASSVRPGKGRSDVHRRDAGDRSSAVPPVVKDAES